ncbi:hypothetical protein [Cytobacillus sp. IB215665]|uniref:hypothetical protein n=1 Tax=Cytobacillus sp. IB215665 TaxID=3097357 RepID=UPI002A152526|nr:hypothetical protein [Cytobacillus sp. IB215665]MDX8367692.1 hypothetical protein [Cytobacillus sp. IB215665]
MYTDKELEEKWMELSDVPFDYQDDEGVQDLSLSLDWFAFKKGVKKGEIWSWFDKRHSKGVGWLLYESGLC